MSKELEIITEYIEKIEEFEKKTKKQYPAKYMSKELCIAIKEKLQRLESIDNANPGKALECLDRILGCASLDEHDFEEVSDNYGTIKQSLIKAQEQEKENEILKEIIKSLFDNGCPLHQYIDKDFGLTIEVDNECSIMHLGEFKGVDLDKKLKEVLE